MNHTQLLNELIIKHDLKSYLEIGIGSGQNFTAINTPYKVGVDPEVSMKGVVRITSDNFFNTVTNQKFDLIFIDGLHHADQVKKDFENSLKCLNENGFIVIHDTCPENEEGTIVPRKTKVWWGDVYKFAMTLHTYEGIEYNTYDIDNGCTVVKKNEYVKGYINLTNVPVPTSIEQCNWTAFNFVGKELMRISNVLT